MSTISEDEIRETVYNLMLDIAINDNLKNLLENVETKTSTIKFLIMKTIKTLCQMATPQGFPTVRGNWVNQRNVNPNFLDLFKGLEQLKNAQNDQQFLLILNGIIGEIEKRGAFKHIIDQLIK